MNRPLANPVFPIPQKVSLDPGATFRLDESCPILVPEQATEHDLFLARFLVAVLSDRFGLPLPIRQVAAVPPEGRSIVVGTTGNPPVRARCEAWGVDVSPFNPGPEGYALLGLSVVGKAGTAGRRQVITLRASYYQQFDADYDLDVPREGYGGWHQADVEIDLDHTALVVMHAWEMGTREQYPGWHRAVEYMPRAQVILETVFPPLLDAVRAHGVTLFHVVGGGDYFKDYLGYRKAVQLAGPTPQLEQVAPDPTLEALRRFRKGHVFVGSHNEQDVTRGFESIDFAPQARPVGDEGIAENADRCTHFAWTGLLTT